MMKPWPYCWDDFLKARAQCIRELAKQGCSFWHIAKTLNLTDADHARRIYENTKNEVEEKTEH